MNAEKQRIAIAEAAGWSYVIRDPLFLRGKKPGSDYGLEVIPDYLNDLDAMHEVEKVLDITNGGPKSGDCLRYSYSRELYKLCPDWLQPFRAPAALRAEAFFAHDRKMGGSQ